MSIRLIAQMAVDIDAACAGLDIAKAHYLTMRRDGRKATMYAIDWLASHGFGRRSFKSGDLLTHSGIVYKVRAITADGAAFSPSVSRGAGRSFERRDFEAMLGTFHEYLVFDAEEMPRASIFAVPIQTIVQWMQAGRLRGDATIDRRDILGLLRPQPALL
jgi:hypothetical protein